MIITEIKALEVLDSRGNPTVEAHIKLASGYSGYGIAPSGASTGAHEALELRDNEPRYHGRGVLKAVHGINHMVASAVQGQAYNTQAEFDAALCQIDGSVNKSRLGSNATIACSVAFARAAAANNGTHLAGWLAKLHTGQLSMPIPMVNVINGGMHADNSLAFQEFMIVPVKAVTFTEKVRMCAEVFHSLKAVLMDAGYSTNVGDEGGFAPKLASAEEAIQYILKAIERARYKPIEDFMLALDVAANSFFHNSYYDLGAGKTLDTQGMLALYKDMLASYPLLSIEDPLAEEDIGGWQTISKVLGQKLMIVGDDLLVTNAAIIEKAAHHGLANAAIIKPNQIGTLSEAWQAVQTARRHGYKLIASHRSGESEDAIIAHMAAAWGAQYIKTGSMSRTDRVMKYNELIRLEHNFV